MVARLLLIRHAATDWNAEQRYCGWIDMALNRKGRNQAKRLCKRLKGQNIDKVYSSDRKRAIETAEIVFEGRDIKKVRDLREMHFGIFEGLTYRQIMKKFPRNYRKWINDPFKTVIPDGESLSIMRKRVIKAFKKIILRHAGETVAIVCHGGVIGAFINYILKSKNFWKHIPRSASLSILESRNSGLTIKAFDSISHLAGIKIDAVKFK